MVLEQIEITSLSDFIEKVVINMILYEKFEGSFVYRGEGSDKYRLLPSALRPETKIFINNCLQHIPNSESAQIFAEYSSIKNFCIEANRNGLAVGNCYPILNNSYDNEQEEFNFDRLEKGIYEKWIPEFLLETASIAQHSGVPTRLLDWSNNIMCALYFACNDAVRKLQSVPLDEAKEIYFSDEKLVIWALNASAIQRVKYDKIGQDDCGKIKLFVPQGCINQNINAQKGILMYRQIHKGGLLNKPIDRTPYDDLIIDQFNSEREPILSKYTIPICPLAHLYKYLDKCGINTACMYPGYEGIVKKINEDSLIESLPQIY